MSSTAAIVLALALPWIRRGESTAAPVPAPQPLQDRVVLVSVTDPEYRALTIPEGARIVPSATERLLVFRKGVCVVDRGLREITRQGASGADSEEGLLERAAAAPDGSGAAVAVTRYAAGPGIEEIETRIVWIDPLHPDGAWTVLLEPGQWVRQVVAFSASLGVAIATTRSGRSGADLRLYGPGGRETLRIGSDTASVVDLVISDDGAFLAADFAYPSTNGTADRGIVVFDLSGGGHWTYAWHYGSDDEPSSWTLGAGGILDVMTAKGPLRFDARGAPIRGKRRRG